MSPPDLHIYSLIELIMLGFIAGFYVIGLIFSAFNLNELLIIHRLCSALLLITGGVLSSFASKASTVEALGISIYTSIDLFSLEGEGWDEGIQISFFPCSNFPSPNPLSGRITIYTAFCIINTMSYKSIWLPLLLERVGVRRIKSTAYSLLLSTFFLKGEGPGLV